MEIKKDIAAKLSAVMKQRDLNVTEFSKELGIARSSLQSYIKGSVEMRLDTAELVSEKMGCSIRLVDGTQAVPAQDLDGFLRSLHPSLLPLAEHSRQMMDDLKELSDRLYDQERRTGGEKP